MHEPLRIPGDAPREAARIGRRLEALVDFGFERSWEPEVRTDVARCDARTVRVTSRRPAMGTLVRVAAIGSSEDRLTDAIDRAFVEMDRLVGLLSRHDRTSSLSHLNRTGSLEGPAPEVATVVEAALDFHRRTGGHFDVTVAPLVLLYESYADAPVPALPSDVEVREALALVGVEAVRCTRRRIALTRSGMALTLDGIAKGYVVDRLAGVLERHGVTRYLVDAGGDIRARGTKEGGVPWTVAVRDPALGGSYSDMLHVVGGAVATSGSYLRAYDAEGLHHHVFDAGTGCSPARTLSASVVAPTAMAADALATAVLLMEPRGAVRFVDGLRGCACLIIDREGAAVRSRRWRSAAPTDGDGIT